ncbi:MAG: alpha/beta fold hydrolase [Sulfitobacter sp.]
MKPLIFALSLITVTGCATRDQIAMVPPVAGAVQHEVLFATNRSANARMFGETRSPHASFGQATVAVPPDHQLGVVEYPARPADPQSEFGLISAKTTTSIPAFEGLVNAQVAARSTNDRAAIVYVHGFNSTFAEALYLNTQLIHDYNRTEVPVLFSWPSSGSSLAYLYDHESVLTARSPLETLLDTLQRSDVESFSIVAHSMGSQLVMETLRQRAIRAGGQQWPKLSAVALVAPDIDVDVFAQLSEDMGGLPQPFAIIASQNDQLLSLSGVVNGSVARVGSLTPQEDLLRSQATLVSADFATEIWSSNHMTAFRSPEMITYLSAFEARLADTR